MYHYLIYATAQASQLGYDFGDLLSWEAEYLTGYLIGDGAGEMNPYLIANYGSPAIVAATNDWAQTWAGQRSLYTPGTDPRQQDATSFSQRYDFTGGYPYIAHAAMSGVYSETNGRTAWEWIDGILGEDAGWDENPMWAIAPVGGIGTPPPVDVTAPLAPTGVVVTPVAVP